MGYTNVNESIDFWDGELEKIGLIDVKFAREGYSDFFAGNHYASIFHLRLR